MAALDRLGRRYGVPPHLLAEGTPEEIAFDLEAEAAGGKAGPKPRGASRRSRRL